MQGPILTSSVFWYQVMKKSMMEMEIDLDKMPLGKTPLPPALLRDVRCWGSG